MQCGFADLLQTSSITGAYQHPDGEWGEVHGFANGYRNPEEIAELIDGAQQNLMSKKSGNVF